MDELQNKLLEYLNGAEKALVDLGPKAWEATVSLVHLNGWLSFAATITLLVISVVTTTLISRWVIRIWNDHDEETAGVMGGFSLTLVVPLWIITAVHLFNKSMWIAIINPELGFLWEVYQKFIAS